VESLVNIGGVSFSKLKHTITNPADSDVFVRYEYSRIDESGHLVSFYHNTDSAEYLATLNPKSAALVHPGTDSAYNAVAKNYYGTIDYAAYPQAPLTVEGKDYTVIPYKGTFTAARAGATSKTIETDYAKNIGLVKSVTKELNGSYVSEDRLVSYKLAP
jgi:hypothetical protein